MSTHQTSYNVIVRWAVASTGGTQFTVVDGPTTVAKALGAAYDPVRNVFLVAWMANPGIQTTHVTTIDPATGAQLADTDLGTMYHTIGSGACKTGGECIFPMATSGINGPCMGWVQGSVNAAKAFVFNEDPIYCIYSFGSSDLTYDLRASSVGAVGSFAQGTSSGYVYRVPDARMAVGVTHEADVNTGFSTDYFPVPVGGMSRAGTTAQFRMYYAE